MELVIEQLVTGFFVLTCLVQLFFFLRYFAVIPGFKTKKEASGNAPVSVLIVAKNEYDNLQKFLPALMELDYPEYEVIVVNNGSWDGSDKLLETFSATYPRLKVVTIAEDEKYPKGKKFGLTLGIKAAKYDILVLTDADCIPRSANWLKHISAAYGPDTEVVLGYSPYQKESTLLNAFIRFETLYTAMQYLSFALRGYPYMGVGRNLSYKKETFFRVKGFAAHNHVVSGDDDLFVNSVANAKNTRICIHRESFVESIPKQSYAEWMHQKRRHLSTGIYYKGSDKTRLGLLHSSHVLFWLSAIAAAVFAPSFLIVLLCGIALRLIVTLVVFYLDARKLREKNLWLLWPLFDLFYPVYYCVTGFRALIPRKAKNAWAFAY